MAVPKCRADIDGQVANFIADFEAAVRGEIEHSADILNVKDCANTVKAYGDYLTPKEMAAAFKRAQKVLA